MKSILTEEIAYKKLSEFFEGINPFVLFGTGLSCAVDICFGMLALRDKLLTEIAKINLTGNELEEWDAVKDLLKKNVDLETSLNLVSDKNLRYKIINISGQFISEINYVFANKIISGEVIWPAISLFEKLLNNTSSPKLYVATTNYDMLAEYAFIANNLSYTTGYNGGVCRKQDWVQNDHNMRCFELTTFGNKSKKINKLKKHIELYKVHGSINTFVLNNTIYENDAWILNPPREATRHMVAPGYAKYEYLHDFRSELLTKYDEAINKHLSYLFLGFGFNDNQLITHSIKNKLCAQEKHGLIITRDNNQNITSLLEKSPNLWLVCRNPSCGTFILNSQYEPLSLPQDELWIFDNFVEKILGG